MSERNGPGGINTERRSPIITSGVATPSVASSNIAVVITVPAINPANKPAKIALVLLTALVDPTEYAPQGNQIAGSAKNEIAHQNLTTCLPGRFHLIRAIAKASTNSPSRNAYLRSVPSI